jgi:hypothetical protein
MTLQEIPSLFAVEDMHACNPFWITYAPTPDCNRLSMCHHLCGSLRSLFTFVLVDSGLVG